MVYNINAEFQSKQSNEQPTTKNQTKWSRQEIRVRRIVNFNRARAKE
jgi:hypothetical protein